MDSGQHSFGRWISILYRYGQSYVGKKLEEYNIGSGQYVILLTLFRNTGTSQEKLSDHLKIDKGSIAKSVKKLEEEGYIGRDIDPDDKRAYKLFLTPKGMDIIPVVQKAIEDWEDKIAADLADSEKEMVVELLIKMAHKACSIKNEENG